MQSPDFDPQLHTALGAPPAVALPGPSTAPSLEVTPETHTSISRVAPIQSSFIHLRSVQACCVLPQFSFQGDKGNGSVSGLEPQRPLKQVICKAADPLGTFQLGFPGKAGVLREEAAGGPADLSGGCHPSLTALHIFSPSKIASPEGGRGGSSGFIVRSFHSVFTALWLSLATWFPHQAPLLSSVSALPSHCRVQSLRPAFLPLTGASGTPPPIPQEGPQGQVHGPQTSVSVCGGEWWWWSLQESLGQRLEMTRRS